MEKAKVTIVSESHPEEIIELSFEINENEGGLKVGIEIEGDQVDSMPTRGLHAYLTKALIQAIQVQNKPKPKPEKPKSNLILPDNNLKVRR